jgi:hypothetical protein
VGQEEHLVHRWVEIHDPSVTRRAHRGRDQAAGGFVRLVAHGDDRPAAGAGVGHPLHCPDLPDDDHRVLAAGEELLEPRDVAGVDSPPDEFLGLLHQPQPRPDPGRIPGSGFVCRQRDRPVARAGGELLTPRSRGDADQGDLVSARGEPTRQRVHDALQSADLLDVVRHQEEGAFLRRRTRVCRDRRGRGHAPVPRMPASACLAASPVSNSQYRRRNSSWRSA